MTRLFKSPKGMALMTIVATYVIMVDINFQQRSRLLSEYNDMVARDLITEDLGGGDCDIGNPTADGNPAPEGSVKTLLASYPGSGKRFSWTIIKALTNGEVADDWNFSDRMDSQPISVKTSWPHKEGTWSW